MSNDSKKGSLTLLIVSAFMFMIVAGVLIYKHFFEFNNDEVEKLLKEKASAYKDSNAALSILSDSAKSVLHNRFWSNQVKTLASSTGLPKETILADAAYSHAKSQKYLL